MIRLFVFCVDHSIHSFC